MTDPETVGFKARQSSHSGFNVQAVADKKDGFLVHTDVVRDMISKPMKAIQFNR